MANNQKYYHNDYKKLLGVDESRTASEKLLDRAIGGFKRQPVEQKQEKAPQKKVKEQNKNLSHSEILGKILKNLQGNVNASKLLKPLAILKKCLNDPGFINNIEINTVEQWISLVTKLLQIQQKTVGNYSQINLMNEQLLQILISLQKLIKNFERNEDNEVKVQQNIKVQQNRPQTIKASNNETTLYKKRCSLLILYCKMYTDDSFVFNKTLLEFKKTFFEYFQQKLENSDSAVQNEQFFKFLQSILMKLFKLPYTKHQWVKTSLSQFYKQFNISYKILLQEELCERYLKNYNQFLNYKLSRGAGESVNIFANSSKGGKITQVQTVSDGLDKWTSKQ